MIINSHTNTIWLQLKYTTLNGPFIILKVVFSEILLYKFTACNAIVNPYEGPLDSGSLAPASTYASTKALRVDLIYLSSIHVFIFQYEILVSIIKTILRKLRHLHLMIKKPKQQKGLISQNFWRFYTVF